MKADGGKAFPSGAREPRVSHYVTTENGPIAPVYHDTGGMSLRDYFAAKAMDMAWECEKASPTNTPTRIGTPTYEGVARRAYLLADAMLKERSKP